MVVKIGLIASTFAAAGLYFGGAFDRYPRIVDGSPKAVMDSLADLDIREFPGEPGSTGEAAGGIKPRFEFSRSANQLEWTVYSGSEVATRMIARFDPVDAGKTRITSFVERGDAPDERISPAFRSTSLTLGLFNASLDAEIEEMQVPGWGFHCDELYDKLMPQFGVPTDQNAVQAIARLHKVRAELMAAGCNVDKSPGSEGGFRYATSTLKDTANDDPEYQDRDPEHQERDPESDKSNRMEMQDFPQESD